MIKVNIKNDATTNVSIKNTNPVSVRTSQLQVGYGHSAYDLAVINGYTGTLQDWLNDIYSNPQQNDIQSNWNKKTTYIPKCGQIIIYNPDSTHEYSRMKIGDGKAYLIDLPFIDDPLVEHINDTISHITATQRTLWNSKVSASYNEETLILQ